MPRNWWLLGSLASTQVLSQCNPQESATTSGTRARVFHIPVCVCVCVCVCVLVRVRVRVCVCEDMYFQLDLNSIYYFTKPNLQWV